MNTQERPPDVPPVNPLVRWFLVGLPLGLIIMGVLSFAFYFHARHAREDAAAAPSPLSAMLRKEVNLEDYRRYCRIFETEIGSRAPDKPENIETAQSFIESTLGFGNMGYQVLRRDFETDGRKCAHLEVELRGRKAAGALVLVTADYTDAASADIAALLVLAQAFTGTEHRNTIRFVALHGNRIRPSTGDDSYRAWIKADEFTGIAHYDVRGPSPNDAAALEALRGMERAITVLADSDSPAPVR